MRKKILTTVFAALIVATTLAPKSANAWYTTTTFGLGSTYLSFGSSYGYGLGYGLGSLYGYGWGRSRHLTSHYPVPTASQAQAMQRALTAFVERKRQTYFAQNIPALDQEKIQQENLKYQSTPQTSPRTPYDRPVTPPPAPQIEVDPSVHPEKKPFETLTSSDGMVVMNYY